MDKPNFIEVYKSVYSDTFCKRVIEYFDRASENKFTINRRTADNVSQIEKEDHAVAIPSEDLPLYHTTHGIVSDFNTIFWNKCYKEYSEKYSILSKLAEHKNYAIKIQKTMPGQGYHIWHCEQGDINTASRLLAWTVYLNDEFEAGETEFLYQQYRYKPSKGDCVIFPASFTHTHRGNPPINGNKYIITGWLEF